MVEVIDTGKVEVVASTPFFMRHSRLPSILSFSTVLCFYGGKPEMRSLLMRLAKGGRGFYETKVKKGYFFRTTILYSNHITMNQGIVDMYMAAKSSW